MLLYFLLCVVRKLKMKDNGEIATTAKFQLLANRLIKPKCSQADPKQTKETLLCCEEEVLNEVVPVVIAVLVELPGAVVGSAVVVGGISVAGR